MVEHYNLNENFKSQLFQNNELPPTPQIQTIPNNLYQDYIDTLIENNQNIFDSIEISKEDRFKQLVGRNAQQADADHFLNQSFAKT
jgi:hypothetical protein